MARRRRLTPEQAARKPGYIGRFMAWLGFGPEEGEGAASERAPRQAREAEGGESPSAQATAAEAEAAAIAMAEAQPAAAEKRSIGDAEPPGSEGGDEVVSLSSARLEDLLRLGMSPTQAKRVLDYRQRMEGFDSVDDLDQLPGFPRDFLAEVKQRLTL